MTPEFTLEVWDEILGAWMVADSALNYDGVKASIEECQRNAENEGRHAIWRVIKTEVVGQSNEQPIGY